MFIEVKQLVQVCTARKKLNWDFTGLSPWPMILVVILYDLSWTSL